MNGTFSITFTHPVPIGQEFGIMDADMTNQSSKPIRMISFALNGTGTGSVIKVVRVYAIPFINNTVSVPDSNWQVYPPAIDHGARCIAEPGTPFRGYVLMPGATIRAYVLIRIAAEGRLRSTSNTVVYSSQPGQREQQMLPRQLFLTAARGAKPNPYDPTELRCLAVTHKLPL